VIADDPYYEIESIKRLRQTKKGVYPEELAKIMKALIKSPKNLQSLEYFVSLTSFNFHAGSGESIRFLKALNKKTGELSQLFSS
jgi:hypothetical protein